MVDWLYKLIFIWLMDYTLNVSQTTTRIKINSDQVSAAGKNHPRDISSPERDRQTNDERFLAR